MHKFILLLIQLLNELSLLLSLLFYSNLFCTFQSRKFSNFCLEASFGLMHFIITFFFHFFLKFSLLLLKLHTVFSLDVELPLLEQCHRFFSDLIFEILLEVLLHFIFFFLQFKLELPLCLC